MVTKGGVSVMEMDEEGEYIHFHSDRFSNWGYLSKTENFFFSRLNQSVVFVALVALGCLLVGRWL